MKEFKDERTELSPNKGRLLENMALVELMRHGYKPGLSLFYYRTRNDREIDLIAKKLLF